MKIIIRNIDGNANEADIQKMLDSEGAVVFSYLQTIVHGGTGRVQTHAYVTTGDRSAGEALIARLNNVEHDGQRLVVKEVK
jgi:RNA recognition motif-containing protein